jgi:hypothetical protein
LTKTALERPALFLFWMIKERFSKLTIAQAAVLGGAYL